MDTKPPRAKRDDSANARTMASRYRRLGYSFLAIPDALNSLGWRTEFDQPFTVETVKQLMKQEIGAVRWM